MTQTLHPYTVIRPVNQRHTPLIQAHRTHALATAFHEAGHALAALKKHRRVFNIEVNAQDQRNGATYMAHAAKNPFDLAGNAGTAQQAWQFSYQASVDELFILLAGPMAEAKLLGSPLKLLGNRSDLDRCMHLAKSLTAKAEFAAGYTRVLPLDAEALMNDTRAQVRRWVATPRIWRAITTVAQFLAEHGSVDEEQLFHLISYAKQKDANPMLMPDYLEPTVSDKPRPPRASKRQSLITKQALLQPSAGWLRVAMCKRSFQTALRFSQPLC